ncbi:SpoIIE family protein phosphatase [Halalkalibacter sp. APA_J-10(15)]|uniref:SpoIIE family protein phosphatase n=1 Tax=unclassified Halalkalibacter TaxID=2893063 RepID=UPI001FF11BD6|nr:SpoIIE family protein phosphatase [Halalkalibacter sp. APA_J-10(15)]MCK0473866.1 SpoIIE family protein phosphatase [Halalkalibacter sp. APA_J-10(15)]
MINHYTDGKTVVVALEKSKPGKSCCGDVHTVLHTDEYMLCTVIDGLGSGEGARRSANIVMDAIVRYHDHPVDVIAEKGNKDLLFERGAVLTIIKIHYEKREISYCNYGNIGFMLCLPDGKLIQPIPKRGYLSGRKSTFNIHYFPFEKDSVFCLYSDGVSSPFNKEQLLSIRELEDIIPYLNYSTEQINDDVTVLVGRITE